MTRRAGLAILLIALGCDGVLESTGSPSHPYIQTDNGLSMNGLVANGLRINGLTMNGVKMNGVKMNGVKMNGLKMNGLHVDGLSVGGLSAEESSVIMSYVVGCALPAEQELTVYDDSTGEMYTWAGALGFAPQLATGQLTDVAQQEWLTACLLAHTNANGNHVLISLRGPGMPPVSDDEVLTYTILEGSYGGNLFTNQPRMIGCAPPWPPPPDLGWRGRSCAIANPATPGLSYCGFTIEYDRSMLRSNSNWMSNPRCAGMNSRRIPVFDSPSPPPPR
jgi:hypothetical protein